jgi:hypothetical protein
MQPRDDPDRQCRQQQLLELLRHLADRIHAIDGVQSMLAASADLDHLLGNARDALDDITLADHHRIVAEARQSSLSFDQTGEE